MKPYSVGVIAGLVVSMLASGVAFAAEPGRSFRMGFTPFPHDMTAQAVGEMQAFIRGNADLLAIHLEGVPWNEALDGQAFHPKMMQEWKDKLAAVPPGGKIYLALSPLDSGRKGLAAHRGAAEGEPLPAQFRGRPLDDAIVKKAYLLYCRRAIDYFKPDYLATGIEVNELYHHDRSAWPQYVMLHRWVYTELKKDRPDLPIFVSFTVHNMLNPSWADRDQMLRAFKELMPWNDVIAVSFYPFMAGLSSDVDQALTWLAQQFDSFGKPYAVAEMGQLGQTLKVAAINLTLEGSAANQASIYERMLAFAQSHKMLFVVSFLYRDYDALWERIRAFSPPAFEVWKSCGLLDAKGNRRPAADVWRRYFQMRREG